MSFPRGFSDALYPRDADERRSRGASSSELDAAFRGHITAILEYYNLRRSKLMLPRHGIKGIPKVPYTYGVNKVSLSTLAEASTATNFSTPWFRATLRRRFIWSVCMSSGHYHRFIFIALLFQTHLIPIMTLMPY